MTLSSSWYAHQGLPCSCERPLNKHRPAFRILRRTSLLEDRNVPFLNSTHGTAELFWHTVKDRKKIVAFEKFSTRKYVG